MADRKSAVKRETKETAINLELNVDGAGRSEIATGIDTLDHLLAQVTKHGRFDLTLKASGDDQFGEPAG